MAQTRQVIQQRSAGVTPSGKTVVSQTTQVRSPELEEKVAVWSVNRFVYYVVGVLETLLAFRFLLKVMGANPGSPFVAFIYNLSAIFVAPFRGIFRAAVTDGIETRSIFEPATLFAMVVYLIIAVGLVKLIDVLTASDTD